MQENQIQSSEPIPSPPGHPDTVVVYCCDQYWFYVETKYLNKWGPMPWYSTTIELPTIPEGYFAYYQSGSWHLIDNDPRPPVEPPPEEPAPEQAN